MAPHRSGGSSRLTPRKPITVVLDTNFLMVPIRFGVDVFLELDRLIGGAFQVAVTTSVIGEIKKLREGAKPSMIKELDFAASQAAQCIVIYEPLKHGESVDDQILRLAKREDYIVATTDNALRRRLMEASVPTVYLRQRNHLEIVGYP